MQKKNQKKNKYEDILETLDYSFKCNNGWHTNAIINLQPF